jgi:DNA-binding CsgD family transcriptional regulator
MADTNCGASADWVELRSLPADTASGLREAVVLDLMATADARCGMYHSVYTANGELHFHDVRVYGDRQRMAYLEDCSGRPLSEFADVSAAVISKVNGFTETTIDEVRSLRMYETMWRRMRCEAVVCMNAVVEGTLVGWVGAHRVEGEPPFGSEAVNRLAGRVDAYVHCLEVAHRLDGAANRARGLLVFDREGEVVLACDSGREWIESAELADRLRAEVRSSEPRQVFSTGGAMVRITPMSGRHGALLSVELSPVEAWQIPEIFRMSPQQRRVAEFAAFGATMTEIARHLGISPWTARSHLKAVYAQLGVASRLELANHLQSFANPA